jgi:thiol-disulfide isomerase/thioredoxin
MAGAVWRGFSPAGMALPCAILVAFGVGRPVQPSGPVRRRMDVMLKRILRPLAAAIVAAVLVPAFAAAQAAPQDAPPRAIVKETRDAIATGDFTAADATVRGFMASHGNTPEALEALSWMGRGLLAAGRLDDALKYAYETERLSLAVAETRPLDAETHLPTALGAAIEVQAQALARQGDLGTAVRVLERNLEAFADTSIVARLNKNLNLLTIEGKPAPAWPVDEFIGAVPPTLASLEGKAVVLFLWAHWCPDCKQNAPDLAALEQKYAGDGLVIVGLTQRYGYVAGRKRADARTEMQYIAAVRAEHFGDVTMSVPVSGEAFTRYGTSTTPTLVLIDRKGIVRLYHPGRMTFDELEPKVRELLGVSLASMSK